MKIARTSQFILLSLLSSVILAALFAAGNSQTMQTYPVTFASCDTSLWDHVYHQERLQVVQQCIVVSGVIEDVRTEKDGDYHILLNVDDQFADLINDANDRYQHGDLVLETICQNPVTQEDAISACENFSKHFKIPPIGSHVKVRGSYVLDTEHNDWAEIHPVSKIRKD